MTTSQKTLRSALEQFRRDGDYPALLSALSEGKKQVNDLLLLQHALQTTDDPDLRDMIDDAAWARANKQPLLRRPSQESLDRIAEGAVRAYGPLINEVLPDLRELAGAMLTQTATPPPVNAVIAAIGLHAQQEAEVFPVSKDNFGGEARFFSIHCSTCGGAEGGKGYILCPACSQRARQALLREQVMAQINRLPSARRQQIDVEATIANNMTAEHLNSLSQETVAGFIKQHAGLYGCPQCHNRPAYDCGCAQTVQVPKGCADGWIVKGTSPGSGKSFYAVLRVRE